VIEAVVGRRLTADLPEGVFHERLGERIIVSIFKPVHLNGHQRFSAYGNQSRDLTTTPAFLDIAYPIT